MCIFFFSHNDFRLYEIRQSYIFFLNTQRETPHINNVYDFHTICCMIIIQLAIFPANIFRALMAWRKFADRKENEKTMKRTFISTLLLIAAISVQASEPWSVERCMKYAADHSHSVRQRQFDLDENRSAKTRAIGAFLPEVYGSVSAQMNFGRAVDPETNAYTDVSTFYNGYGLQASLTIFDGLQRYNELRMARANVAMGRSAVQAEKDATALQVCKACMDLLYCQGAVEHTMQKREESLQLLRQTEVMAEVGQKSEADVAQMRATLAADDYELTHMQSQTTKALLTLKQLMNFPIEDTLIVERPSVETLSILSEADGGVTPAALARNPRIAQAESQVAAARYGLWAALGGFLPKISLSGGVSTSFFRNMDTGGHAPFSQQFKNNAGEYVAFTLSIPIFNRLATLTTVRSRRIALDRACETLDYERSELRRLVAEATADVRNSEKEILKTNEQVEADSIAAHITTRKFEEGMASAIDVRTAAVTLLQSRVKLLQSQLTMMYNRRLLAYYRQASL